MMMAIITWPRTSTIKKEALALRWAIEEFIVYLWGGGEFQVITNHQHSHGSIK